jgi:hypothetical protein
MSLPVIGPGDTGIPNQKQHLVVKIKPGWHFSEDQNAFVSPDEQASFRLQELPSGARVVYVAPQLARGNPRNLSADERNLALYLQVIFEQEVDLEHYLDTIRKWPCIDQVRLPADVSLP